ncbi:UNVERIFIED_CONTAM: Fungalysin/Thermolysin Extracellular metalloproteinase 5 [Siphonaria sp. JEL0065]|nr:Fungalysin/Thermolysin Extracellular metalloproteinase 5 [Siphonaria sp. JEL0065]
MLPPSTFVKLLSVGSVLLQASAAPVQPSTEYYQPTASTTVIKAAANGSSAFSRVKSTLANAQAVAVNHFASLDADVSISHSHSLNNIQHIYTVQKFDGLEIVNAVSSMNILPDGSAIVHNSLAPASLLRNTTPLSKRGTDSKQIISVESAIQAFAASQNWPEPGKLHITQSGNEYTVSGASFATAPIKASQKYYQTEDKLLHVWDLQVQTEPVWVNVFIHSGTGRIVAKNNWTRDFVLPASGSVPVVAAPAVEARRDEADANVERRAGSGTYNVIPIGRLNPSNGFTVVSSPADANASPNGWHSSTYLSGNNVDATSIVQSTRPSSSSYTFTETFNASADPANPTAATVGLTQMFYTANMAHDIFYNYGFTPAAGNFQKDGGDQVNAVTQQSGIGIDNNASFSSGPDGTPGRMNVGLFTSTSPRRDGALDLSVVIHEMAHGLTDRLTGGARDNNCLKGTEQNGLAEGWSDTVAFVLTTTTSASRATDWMLAAWASNKAGGLRDHPYSTSVSTNPYMYSDVWSFYTQGAHKIGQVWANALYEVMWNMNDRSGITDPSNIISGFNSGYGNTDFLKLLITGVKIQPCNPTFIQARNAIITAEAALFGGKYKCDVWKGFAKRGMGASAAGPQANDFTVPSDACDGVIVTTTKAVTSSTTATTTKPTASSTSTTTTTTKVPVSSTTTTTTSPVISVTKAPTTSTTTTTTASTTKAPTTSTTTTTTVKVVTTSAAVGGTSAGAACTSNGAWACSNSLVCSYGAGNKLIWVKVGSISSC